MSRIVRINYAVIGLRPAELDVSGPIGGASALQPRARVSATVPLVGLFTCCRDKAERSRSERDDAGRSVNTFVFHRRIPG